MNFKFPTYPTGQIQLNRQHPLAKGLVWAGNGNSLDVNNFVDLSVRQLGLGQPVGNQSYTPIYNPEFGRGLILNGNSGFKFDRDWEVSELTVLAWVRCAAGGGSQAIICVPINEGTHNSPFWSWTLSQNNNFEFKLEWYDGSGQNVSYSGEPVFNNTDIVHLAITLSSAGNVEFFVNGVSVKTDTNGNSLQDDINQPLRIGLAGSNTNDEFKGDFYHGEVYNRVLNSSEIYQKYDPATRWAIYSPPSIVLNAPAAIDINLGFISSATALHDVTENQNVATGLIGSNTTLYDSSINQNIATDFISDTTTLYAHDVNISIALELINSTSAIHAPELNQTVNLDFIASETTIFNPGLNQNIALNHIVTDSSIYDLTTGQAINLGFITDNTVLYDSDTNQDVNLGHIATSTSLQNPSISTSLSVSLDFISSSESLHNPDINQNLQPGFINSDSALHVPEIDQIVTTGFISSETALYSATINQTLDLDAISTETVVYAPSVDGEQSINPGFIASSTSIHNLDTQQNISIGHISSLTTIHETTLTQSLSLGFIAGESTFFTLSALTNPQINLSLINSGTVLYNQVVSLNVIAPDDGREIIVQPYNRIISVQPYNRIISVED